MLTRPQSVGFGRGGRPCHGSRGGDGATLRGKVMRKILVSAMVVGATAAAGAAVSAEARAESASASVSLDAAVKGGQALIDIRRSFNDRISRSGSVTATVDVGSGDNNTVTVTGDFTALQSNGILIGPAGPTDALFPPNRGGGFF
jgi:hypothetical protein